MAGIANGGIYDVNARTGRGDFLVPPQTNGRKAVGLKFQRGADRLIVAGGDTGHAYIYDADSGESLADLELANAHAEAPPSSTTSSSPTTRPTSPIRSGPVFYRVDLGCGGEVPGPGRRGDASP